MKKSTKKVVKYLERYVGKEIIRTKPVDLLQFRSMNCRISEPVDLLQFRSMDCRIIPEDRSFTDRPLLLLGFTPDGCIRYKYTSPTDRMTFGDKEFVLPIYFTDLNYITYKKA